MSTATLLVLVVLGIAQLALVWVLYQKLSKGVQDSRHEQRRQADNVIRQVEALMAVHAVLEPRAAPPRSRGWAASPDFLHVLLLTAQARRAACIVECSSGYSTLVMAACARKAGTGHVYSLEHDTHYAALTRQALELHELSAWATVIDAPLRDLALPGWKGVWYDTDALHRALPQDAAIDLLAIDGPPNPLGPAARYPAVPQLLARMAPDCRIVLDDADREAEQTMLARWRAEFPDLVQIDTPECEKGCVTLQKQQGMA